MKKYDSGYIRYSLLSGLFSSLVVVFFFSDLLFNEETGTFQTEMLFLLLGLYCIVYIARVVYSILFVRSSGYALTATEITCRKGVLCRKTSVLPYSKVHAVNKKQNLLHRLCGIAVLTVDSGATTSAFRAEITIIEKTAVVDALLDEIKARQEGRPVQPLSQEDLHADKENLYRFSSKLKWVYSALTAVSSLVALGILGVLALAVVSILGLVLRSSPDFSLSDALLGVLLVTGLCLVLIGIFSLICGILASFVSYHNFTVYKTHADLEISYGLLSRQTNVFKLERIKAVKIQEGPVKRLFGFVSVGLEVVGYGVESSSEDSGSGKNGNAAPGMLLPLCRAKDLDSILSAILPDYVPAPIRHRAKSYRPFVLWSSFWTAFGFCVAACLAVILLAALGAQAALAPVLGALVLTLAASLALVAVLGALRYRNAGLTVEPDKLTVQNGTFIRRRTVIRPKDLIAMESIATPMQKKRGIASYQIHFFSNALTNSVTVHHLDAGLEKSPLRQLKD